MRIVFKIRIWKKYVFNSSAQWNCPPQSIPARTITARTIPLREISALTISLRSTGTCGIKSAKVRGGILMSDSLRRNVFPVRCGIVHGENVRGRTSAVRF